MRPQRFYGEIANMARNDVYYDTVKKALDKDD
jgi:hypothetical protein